MTVERRRLIRGLRIWIDILFFVALLASAVVLIFWPAPRITQGEWQDMGVRVQIDAGSQSDPAETLNGVLGLTPPNRITDVEGELRMTLDGVAQGLVFWLIMAVSAGAGLLVLQLLRRILATTEEGRPFHPANVRRLNLLGWILTAAGVVGPFGRYLYARWILAGQPVLAGGPIRPPLSVDGGLIFMGLLLLVLASVWKEAARMAEEQSLTI